MAAATLLTMTLGACSGDTTGTGNSGSNSNTNDSTNTNTEQTTTATGGTAEASSSDAVVISASVSLDSAALSEALAAYQNGVSAIGAAGSSASFNLTFLNSGDLFTDRDTEGTYEESEAVQVTLNGNSATCEGKGVSIDGENITITQEGVYVFSGTLSDGQIIVEADEAKVQLVLNGVSITNDDSACIYVKSADKVFVTLAENSTNTLTTTGTFVADGDTNIDGVIYAKDDLCMNGSGALTINSTDHGVVCKDDLKVTGGSYVITATGCALQANDSIRISGGVLNLDAGTDAIHAANDEDTSLGYIYICGGSFQIKSGTDGLDGSGTVQIDGGSFTMNCADDAFHSDADLIINCGEISISQCYEGLEGTTITVNGGNITMNSSDDALNAAGGNDSSGFGQWGENFRGGMEASGSGSAYAMINGGVLNLNADGDGLDANGSLYVTGGEVYLSGPSNSGNGALDYDSEGIITGGTLVAVGASGMAMNFGSSSTQCAILTTLSSTQNAGTVVSLKDAAGNEIVSYTTLSSYNSVLISSPEIAEDGSYTLTAGSDTSEIVMTGVIYGASGGMGGMMAPGGGMGGQGGFGGRGQNSTDGTMTAPSGEMPSGGPGGQGGFGGRQMN